MPNQDGKYSLFLRNETPSNHANSVTSSNTNVEDLSQSTKDCIDPTHNTHGPVPYAMRSNIFHVCQAQHTKQRTTKI